MKEVLYTIPMNDAMNAEDECPFCFIERNIEQDQLDFVLGSGASYMEADIRALTDAEGFCRTHMKAMFNYGNALGNGWILKTYYAKLKTELANQMKKYQPGKTSLKDMLIKPKGEVSYANSVAAFLDKYENSCYICKREEEMYDRYLNTFFVMFKDEEFRNRVKNSKGFCLSHFKDLCEYAEKKESEAIKKSFFEIAFELMNNNMDRLYEDVSWLIEKYDYRNNDADWKNSKDAIQRGMQKLKGGYPADPPYKRS